MSAASALPSNHSRWFQFQKANAQGKPAHSRKDLSDPPLRGKFANTQTNTIATNQTKKMRQNRVIGASHLFSQSHGNSPNVFLPEPYVPKTQPARNRGSVIHDHCPNRWSILPQLGGTL